VDKSELFEITEYYVYFVKSYCHDGQKETDLLADGLGFILSKKSHWAAYGVKLCQGSWCQLLMLWSWYGLTQNLRYWWHGMVTLQAEYCQMKFKEEWKDKIYVHLWQAHGMVMWHGQRTLVAVKIVVVLPKDAILRDVFGSLFLQGMVVAFCKRHWDPWRWGWVLSSAKICICLQKWCQFGLLSSILCQHSKTNAKLPGYCKVCNQTPNLHVCTCLQTVDYVTTEYFLEALSK